MVKIRFYDPSFKPPGILTYSVIVARFGGKWMFVRHRKRETLEIPGGHIEDNESSGEAAYRELYEETGSTQFELQCVSTYSVEQNGKTGYGRLYFAEVSERGEINDKSEIEELILSEELPDNLTYPEIQPALFDHVIKYVSNKGP
jgi:8-oxo-dGTP diphosphatase